jgi:hypothetical protein
MSSALHRNLDFEGPPTPSEAWEREAASDERLGIDPGIRDNPEEDDVESKFEPEDNDYEPSYSAGLSRSRRRIGAVLWWTGAMAVLGIAVAFGVAKFATTWTAAASRQVRDSASSGVQVSDQPPGPASRIGTPVEVPKPPAAQLIVAQGSPGEMDEALAMNVSLSNAPTGAMIAIYGLASGSTLNVGRVSGTNGWRLMAADLRIALIRPPQGFVGAMQLGLELRLADESVADLKTLRLEWLAPLWCRHRPRHRPRHRMQWLPLRLWPRLQLQRWLRHPPWWFRLRPHRRRRF